MTTFEYRVVRRGEELGVHEVYFAPDGRIRGITVDAFGPMLDSVEGLRLEYEIIVQALDRPILEEPAEYAPWGEATAGPEGESEPDSPDEFLAEVLDVLERTPAVLAGLLRGSRAATRQEPSSWSPYEVLGHLILGEENDWVPRARILLESKNPQPFEPFDRYAQHVRFASWTLDSLLDRFAEIRCRNLDIVRGWKLGKAQLDRQGHHPELGIVRLRDLIAAWAVHDLGHLAQVNQALAKRFRFDLGPFRGYSCPYASKTCEIRSRSGLGDFGAFERQPR